MTPDLHHLRDEIQDLLDDRLGARERADAQAHLEVCEECRHQLRRLEWIKRLTAGHLTTAEVPDSLRANISAALDREDARAASQPWWRVGFRRPAAIAACALLVAGVVAALFFITSADVPAAVARDYRDYKGGTLSLERRTVDPKDLESFFTDSGIRFHTRVFDFAMMNYRLVGGRVHTLAGRPSAAYVYQGHAGKILLCEMYEGRAEDLPDGARVREHNGITFRIYRTGGVTMAFWQEGNVICVLASDIDAEELAQLAFAKAVKL